MDTMYAEWQNWQEQLYMHLALGKSVVDYICVPQEKLSMCSNFEVLTMTELINYLKLLGQTRIQDHSLLHFCLELPFAQIDNSERTDEYSHKLIKYNLSEIPASYLNDEQSFVLINQTIASIESAITAQANIDLAYDNFTSLLQTKMESKLKKSRTNAKITNKRHKSRAKPYWSDEIHDIWVDLCKTEKSWLSCKLAFDMKRLREEHCFKRREFNKLLRRAKRRYQIQQQQKMHDELHDTENPRSFWKDIGKLGLARERKSCIPMEIINHNNQIKHVMFYINGNRNTSICSMIKIMKCLTRSIWKILSVQCKIQTEIFSLCLTVPRLILLSLWKK